MSLINLYLHNSEVIKIRINEDGRMKHLIDKEKGKRLAEALPVTFNNEGIFGYNSMPEDALPNKVDCSSLEHIMFITLTVSIDYTRNAKALWESARKTYQDPETNYLFDAKKISEKNLEQIKIDMAKYNLSKKREKDAKIWKTIGTTFYRKWDGDPRKFLHSCNWSVPNILCRLRGDSHEVTEPDFPYLRGPKIGPLWLRMLRDNVGIKELCDLEELPIPVDVHVARATLATGIVRGSYNGTLNKLFPYIRKAWHESVESLYIFDRPMIAIDMDESLWHLSQYGCTNRDKQTGYCKMKDVCPAKNFCVLGKIILDDKHAEFET